MSLFVVIKAEFVDCNRHQQNGIHIFCDARYFISIHRVLFIWFSLKTQHDCMQLWGTQLAAPTINKLARTSLASVFHWDLTPSLRARLRTIYREPEWDNSEGKNIWIRVSKCTITMEWMCLFYHAPVWYSNVSYVLWRSVVFLWPNPKILPCSH